MDMGLHSVGASFYLEQGAREAFTLSSDAIIMGSSPSNCTTNDALYFYWLLYFSVILLTSP
jgi:hypothetical protein